MVHEKSNLQIFAIVVFVNLPNDFESNVPRQGSHYVLPVPPVKTVQGSVTTTRAWSLV